MMFKSFFLPRKLNLFLKLVAGLNILAGLSILLAYLATFIDPKAFWPLAFFGLAYPLLLVANLFFIVFWFVLRSKWILLSGMIVLLGFNHLRHFVQISLPGGPLPDSETQLKIMSWNVRLFDLYNWKDHNTVRHSIFEVLKREDADILCFQEFFYSGISGFFETRDTLTKFLRTKHVHEGYTHKMRNEQYFGLAIFSAYPFVDRGEIRFPNDDNNNVIFADINTGKDTIRIYNAHLSSIRFQRSDYAYIGDTANTRRWLHPWEQPKAENQKIIQRLKSAFIKRSEQAAILRDHILTSPYPVVLAGDFNDSPVSYFYRTFSSFLTDAFIESGNGIGSTYIGKFPSFRIDYIFHSPGLHSFGYATLPEKLSDHHGITVTIDF